MASSARIAVCGLGLLILFASWADGASSHYPPPPGLDPDDDGAHRARYQKGKSAWHRSYLYRMRQQWEQASQVAPVYFYRRTCGKDPPARQIILRLASIDLDNLLKDDASQLANLLYLRWLIEVYWRLIVPVYALEPRPVYILDLDGISWRTIIANSVKITSLIKKINSAFYGVTGKGMDTLYIWGAPYGFNSILNAATKLVTFRNDDVIMITSDRKRREFQEAIGEACLWEGYGGKSRLPLEGSPAQKAFSIFSKVEDTLVENPDVIRLTAEAENFPTPEAIAEFQEQLAVRAAKAASEAEDGPSSQISTECEDC